MTTPEVSITPKPPYDEYSESDIAHVQRLKNSPQYGMLSGTFRTKRESNHFKNQIEYSFPHAHPNSVTICVIGPSYSEGAYERIRTMGLYLEWLGYECWFEEIMDDGADIPGTATITPMRDIAILAGLSRGTEWIVTVDADAQPEPDTIAKLLSHDRAVISPIIVDPETGTAYGFPAYSPNSGVVPVRWCLHTLVLWRATIFNCLGISSQVTSPTEESLTRKLWYYGHRWWLDTYTELKVSRPPTFPGDLTWKEFWDKKRRVWNHRKDIPDRRPIDPNDALAVNGVWMPSSSGALWKPVSMRDKSEE